MRFNQSAPSLPSSAHVSSPMRAFQNSTVQLVQHRAAGPSLSPPGTTNIACQGHAIDHCHRAAQHRTALAAGPSPRCLEHVASIRRAASAICCETTTQGVAWGKNRVRVRRGQPIKAASADGSERGSQRLPGADRSSLQKTTVCPATYAHAHACMQAHADRQAGQSG